MLDAPFDFPSRDSVTVLAASGDSSVSDPFSSGEGKGDACGDGDSSSDLDFPSIAEAGVPGVLTNDIFLEPIGLTSGDLDLMDISGLEGLALFGSGG